MLRLCGFRISNYHNKVRSIVLLEKGIAFEEDDTLAPKQTDEYLARSPMGKAPFLELDAGRCLSESQVICEYLEDAYPHKPLKELAKGVRAFKALARFDPYLAGGALTLADCAAFVHLPLVSLASKLAYRRDFLENLPQVKPCLRMLRERPAFHQVNEDRKAAQKK